MNDVNTWPDPNIPTTIDNTKETFENSINRNEKQLQGVVITDERYRRVKREEPSYQNLLNDEKLRANVEKIFGPKTELERAHEKFDITQLATDENILSTAEVQKNIETVFGTVPPSLALEAIETNNPKPQPSLKVKANQDEVAGEQPSLQAMIFNNFGPEVINSEDDKNKLNETNKIIEESISIGKLFQFRRNSFSFFL